MRALGAQAVLLPGWALAREAVLWPAVERVIAEAPFRRMHTPSGNPLRVQMTSCGAVGWVGDTRGYRYEPVDPERQAPWPALPDVLKEAAEAVAREAGFPGFSPDTCLINRYQPGDALALHQDRDEKDWKHPVVSLSFGAPAWFLWGGLRRTDSIEQVRLEHGDAVAWGGVDRLRFHGILPLSTRAHPSLGAQRINLTFRRAT